MNNKNNIETTNYQFFFDCGLYEIVEMQEKEIKMFIYSLYQDNVIGYNPLLKSETTFSPRHDYIPSSISSMYEELTRNGLHKIILECKRDATFKIVFYLYKTKNTVQKIGQLPSYADLQKIDKDFEKELSKEDKINYNKAIGLFSHGANIGAYAYLRRIFENMIINAFDENSAEIKIINYEFMKLRMDEKITLLKKYLPESLVEFKSFYGIISKGIHELSEEDCGKYFSILKNIIDMCIKESIIKKQEVKRKKELKKAFQQAQEELTSNN
jgi:hypothetical protein